MDSEKPKIVMDEELRKEIAHRRATDIRYLCANDQEAAEEILRQRELAALEAERSKAAAADDPVSKKSGKNKIKSSEIESLLNKQWRFYKEVFNIDLGNLVITPPPVKPDFNWPLLVHASLTHNRVLASCERMFNVNCSDKDLDAEFSSKKSFNIRDPRKNGTYLIYLRNRVEADGELKNLSADDIKAQNINSITLLERLLLELWYHWRTKEHLDPTNSTLCAGSRYHDGLVPGVHCYDGELYVYWCHASNRSPRLRARAVVS